MTMKTLMVKCLMLLLCLGVVCNVANAQSSKQRKKSIMQGITQSGKKQHIKRWLQKRRL